MSNRLPVTIADEPGVLGFAASSGGLVTGLQSVQREMDSVWIGWPGSVRKEDHRQVERRLLDEYGCVPVFIPDRVAEKYYEGFSNRTIWPLFHSFPTVAKYVRDEWEAYRDVNKLFARCILNIVRPGDMVWVHDYHLMLLPRYLREQSPDLSIGFFLHIPFPYFDILRLLPQHREIVESLLGANLIGFHTHDYAQAFLGSVRRLLGHDNVLGELIVEARIVQVDVFPMGIDFGFYAELADTPEVQARVAQIRGEVHPRSIVFAVSRLDYTKGIPQSLSAIEQFFETFPEWREKVVFFFVVVPSRERVEDYASLKAEIDESIGRINSTYGTLHWSPVRYIYRNLSTQELVALYVAADIALVIPLRDGMNLIAKEYLAASNHGQGVLVLSEMAGAAKELLEAIIVNPNSSEEVAAAIRNALALPAEERRHRNAIMRERLKSHDVHQWVGSFLRKLDETTRQSEQLATKVLDARARAALANDYRTAASRLVILDYDGTLVPFASEPHLAVPDQEIRELLFHLASAHGNTVVLLSGRDRHTLGEWLCDLPAILVAEHGGWHRKRIGAEWEPTIQPAQQSWKDQIRPMLELFVERIPGSLVEEKTFSLVWHYRKADVHSGSTAAKELLDTITNLTANLGIHVLLGNKTVEVRTTGIGKGFYYNRNLAPLHADFVLAMGDDWTDEDLFAVLPPNAYSVKVGVKSSRARFHLRSVSDVRALLHFLEGQYVRVGTMQHEPHSRLP